MLVVVIFAFLEISRNTCGSWMCKLAEEWSEFCAVVPSGLHCLKQ